MLDAKSPGNISTSNFQNRGYTEEFGCVLQNFELHPYYSTQIDFPMDLKLLAFLFKSVDTKTRKSLHFQPPYSAL